MKFVPLVLYILSWIFAWTAKAHYQYFTEALFLFILLVAVGIRQLIAFINNSFFPENTTKITGQAPGTYQKNTASANLGLGIAGVLSYFQPIFSFGTALVATVFFLTVICFWFNEMKANTKQHLKNYWPFILANALTPITLIYCFWHMHHITKIL